MQKVRARGVHNVAAGAFLVSQWRFSMVLRTGLSTVESRERGRYFAEIMKKFGFGRSGSIEWYACQNAKSHTYIKHK